MGELAQELLAQGGVVLAMQQQMAQDVRKIKTDVNAVLKLSEAHFRMLYTLLVGVDELAPKLICFLPAEDIKARGHLRGWLNKLTSPKDWFNQRVRIFFIDPITHAFAKTNNGDGFEIEFPKVWVARAMPYVKLGLTVLKVAVVAGKLGGIPVPDIESMAGEWVDKQLEVLNELKGEGLKELTAMTANPTLAAELVGAVDKKCEEMLSEKMGEVSVSQGKALGEKLRAPLTKSLQELDALLKGSYPDWKKRCGLVRTTAHDGTTEWVLPEHVEQFTQSGMAMFANSVYIS